MVHRAQRSIGRRSSRRRHRIRFRVRSSRPIPGSNPQQRCNERHHRSCARNGNDHRAIEAGGHAYAAINGPYSTFSKWTKNKNGDLEGVIELPMAVGLIGGAVKTHPIARIAMKILGVKSANEFAEVLAAVGLAQNLGALRALSNEGIQRGHVSARKKHRGHRRRKRRHGRQSRGPDG